MVTLKEKVFRGESRIKVSQPDVLEPMLKSKRLDLQPLCSFCELVSESMGSSGGF